MAGMYNQTGKGPYRYQSARYKGGIAIAACDLMFRDTDGYDKPVSFAAFTTDIATTAVAVRPLFAGVSTARKSLIYQPDDSTDKFDGAILGSGEFTFPCPVLAAPVKRGDYVTFVKAAGNAINPQQVQPGTAAAGAIGKITKDGAVGEAYVTFELMPETFGATI